MEERRGMAPSSGNVIASPRCVWGEWDSSCARPSRRQARPPPSTSNSILSAENLIFHDQTCSENGTRNAVGSDGSHGRFYVDSRRDGSYAASSRSRASSRKSNPSPGECITSAAAGTARGLGWPDSHSVPNRSRSSSSRPKPSIEKRLDWNDVVAEAEKMGAVAASVRNDEEAPYSLSMPAVLAQPPPQACSVDARLQEQSARCLSTPWASTRSDSAETPLSARRLRNAGACAPLRGSWEAVFPTRELHSALPNLRHEF